MSEIARHIDQASAHVEPAWSAEREARVRARIGHGIQRRQRQRTALVVALGTCTLLLGFFLGRAPGSTARHGIAESAPRIGQQSLVQLPDGSSVHAVSPDARVATIAVGPSGVTLRLDSGTARFSVTPNPKRPFRVIARDATVTVLGTVFTVALDPQAIRVEVERGRVKVDGVEGTRVLTVGESGRFATRSPGVPADPANAEPLPASAPGVTPAAAPAAPAPEPPVGARSAPAAAQPSWRTLAQDQNYVGALARLTAEGPNAVRDTPEDLLLEADVARLGGRPDRAVAPLQRVISEHPFDPRAPLAAFTLGRTLLEQLGRPREAARAFATARRLDRGGTLTQDALAREIESWAGAGEAEQAHERALEYVRLYPHGRRLAAVRRLGGVDQ
jgi:transmembrane sensor